MAEADIRIRVGVVADASVSSVLTPIEQSVRRARKLIESEMKAASKAVSSETQRGATAAETSWKKLEREVEREANKILAAEERAQRQSTREYDRSEREKTATVKRESQERVRAEQAASREVERSRRSNERASRGGAIGIGYRAAISVGRGAAIAYGLGGRAAQTAMGIGRDIMGGLGVDTNLSSLVGKSAEQQSLATKISNSAYIPGQTQLVDPHTILAEARAASNATGTDTTETLQALQDFVGKTGDLETARATIGDMAKLSRATGTNLADMANASAEVANSLGDVPNKAELTNKIMRQIAGQGKLGAVEIKDLASQMAKLAASAAAFKGGAAANIATFGIIAQEAKLRGGASSATQAATSVMAFTQALTKGATVKNWKAAGLTPFADKKGETTLSDPKELIIAALRSTKGNLEKLGKLFPSSQAMRAVRGFANIYSQAGGGQAGEKAVQDEFKHLADAQLNAEEIQRAFTASMGTSEAKVNIFNNKMAELAEKLAGAVLPAFEALAPAIINVANSFASAVEDFLGTKAPREQQEALNTELTAMQDRAKVQRSITRDAKTGQLSMPEESQKILETDASKLAEKVLRQKQIVAQDEAGAAGINARVDKASGFWGKIGAASGGVWDTVTGQRSAAEDKARADRQEQGSLEQNLSIQNSLLKDIRDHLANGTLKVMPPTPAPSASQAGRGTGSADVSQDGGHN